MHSSGIIALLAAQGADNSSSPRRYNTRRVPRDFRVEAGLRKTSHLKHDEMSQPARVQLSANKLDAAAPSTELARAVDTPSTRPTTPTSEDVSPAEDFTTDPLAPEAWRAAYEKCEDFREAFCATAASPDEAVRVRLRHMHPAFKRQGHFLVACIKGLWKICVPSAPEFRSHVLYRCHDHVTAGHRGQKKTFDALSRQYFLPGMRSYCNRYVESCVACRASKALSQRPAGLLQPLVIPSRRWGQVSLDFITDLPRSKNQNDAVLVIVDTLSKMAHFVPTRKAVTAEDTVDLLADRLIRYHGFSDVLLSDRDPRFTSELWHQLCKRFNIKRALSSAYHPQTDGQTERVNQTLEQMLRTYIQSDESDWERLLPALELAYNCTSHSATELSPFEVLIGENPVTAETIDVIGNLPPTLSPPMTKLFRQLCDRAHSHIARAKWRQKVFADAKRREEEFQVGDLVWISARNLPPQNSCSKFEPRFRGPFRVTEKIGKVAYRVALPPSYLCHDVFHVSLLVRDRPRPPTMNSKEAAVGWLPITDTDGKPTDQFEVDYILQQEGEGDSARYLVKWRGMPEDRATWEPAANLTGCDSILRAFKRKQNAKQQRRPQQQQRDSGGRP